MEAIKAIMFLELINEYFTYIDNTLQKGLLEGIDPIRVDMTAVIDYADRLAHINGITDDTYAFDLVHMLFSLATQANCPNALIKPLYIRGAFYYEVSN